MLTVRLPPDILNSVDELANKKGVSRAMLVRNILANCRKFDEFLEAEIAKGEDSRIQLEEDLARQVKANYGEELTPIIAHMMAETMRRVMDKVIKEMSHNAGKKERGKTKRSKVDS